MNPAALAQVLRELPEATDPALLVGGNTADDAAVYRVSDDLALVSSVDVFTPIVDDPYVFGQIAAANALSDIYAMGAEPLYALNVVGFPHEVLDQDILVRILQGGQDKAAEADIAVAGGHTIDEPELKYGMVIHGQVSPADVITNAGAKPGDALVLTKPIGVGIITTAARADAASDESLAEAIALMTQLNRSASECMQRVGVTACTDVTGFGLLGHLHEMAAAGGVTMVVSAGAVPLVTGAVDLAEQFLFPEGLAHIRDHCEGFTEVAGEVSDDLFSVFCDPQTSGGLAIAVDEARAEELLAALHEAGVAAATRIGHAEEGSAGVIRVVS
jgi:selenide,water dikinase